MKPLLATACLVLMPLPAPGKDRVTIETKVIESTGAIAHDLEKLASAKGVEVLSAPDVTTCIGEEAEVRVIREFIAPTVASEFAQAVDTGLILRIKPLLKDDKLSFNAHLSLRELKDSRQEEQRAQTELSAREILFSGITGDGDVLWYEFPAPKGGKTLTVWMRLKREQP